MTGYGQNRSRAPSARARRDADRSLLLAALLVALSALCLGRRSGCGTRVPTDAIVDHGGWGRRRALAALCRAVPQGDLVVPGGASCRKLGADDRGDDAADDVSGARALSPHHQRPAGRRPADGAGRGGLFCRVVRVRPRRACAGCAARISWRRGSRRCMVYGWAIGAAVLAGARSLPVQRAQVPLPRAMPHAVRLRRFALARTRPAARGVAPGRRSRRVLRRLLLGVDAADVRRRHRATSAGCLRWPWSWPPRRTCPGAGGCARRWALGLLGWAGAIAIAHL